MSKIVAGQAGGLPLKSVPGPDTRPTTERAKEAIFSWLETRDWLNGTAVLDLYTGSGGLAVEAASRGATKVVGIEIARSAAKIAQHNAEIVNTALGTKVVEIVTMPVHRYLQATPEGSWDLILADPPYDIATEELHPIIEQAFTALMDDGLFMLERPFKAAAPDWPADTYVVDDRRYGEARVFFVRRLGY